MQVRVAYTTRISGGNGGSYPSATKAGCHSGGLKSSCYAAFVHCEKFKLYTERICKRLTIS
jgi:hypothetical protein